MQDSIRINLELHAYAGHAARRGLELDGEFAEAPIVLRPLAFALQDVDEHVALTVHRGREQLARLERNRGVARDQNIHQAAKRFEAKRQRRHVQQQNIFKTAGQNLRLDRRAERHGLVRILRRVELRAAGFVKVAADAQTATRLFKVRAAEQFAHKLAHQRHPRLAADKDDLIQILRLQFRVRQRAQAMRPGAGDDVARQIFQLGARELVAERKFRSEKRQRDFHFRFRRKFYLCQLRRLANPRKRGLPFIVGDDVRSL